MCDANAIHPACTGEKEFKLGDGREVCKACLPCVTGGQEAKPTGAFSSPSSREEDWGDKFCTTK